MDNFSRATFHFHLVTPSACDPLSSADYRFLSALRSRNACILHLPCVYTHWGYCFIGGALSFKSIESSPSDVIVWSQLLSTVNGSCRLCNFRSISEAVDNCRHRRWPSILFWGLLIKVVFTCAQSCGVLKRYANGLGIRVGSAVGCTPFQKEQTDLVARLEDWEQDLVSAGGKFYFELLMSLTLV